MFTLIDTYQVACHGTSFKTFGEAYRYAMSLRKLGLCKTFSIGKYTQEGHKEIHEFK